ncbi:hypothetical protein HYALB_00008523 [Hymenoscyphus albidus]|uniref:Uncharacterized protein n=1 Tax=Hymenoscyphus albidus TaxID=595503 RepID=A0A9N9LJN1_9HELO|nr:hypothetical protein HYALB_00008523 [Hymenoscyphus albidus]
MCTGQPRICYSIKSPSMSVPKFRHQERSYPETRSLSTINYELQIILVPLENAEKLGLVRASKRAHHFCNLVIAQCKNLVGGYKNTVYANHSEYNDDQETTITKNFGQVGGPLNRRLDHLEVAIVKHLNDMADTAT